MGRGEDKGGMRDGKRVDPERKMEEGVSEEESPNRKEGLVLRKEECEGKGRGEPSKNRQKSDAKWGEQEKMDYAGQKTGAVPRKIARNRVQNGEGQEKRALRRAKNESSSSKKRPKSGSKRGKASKTEISERKRRGGGEVKNWALLPILQCYEVAKWAQMKFSRIFFR